MTLLDYTTEIPATRSLGEIQELLGWAGAQRVMVTYNGQRRPISVAFTVPTESGEREFELPARVDKVLAKLGLISETERDASGKRKLPMSWVTTAHAERVAWRILRHWLDGQVALIQIGMVTVAEVMLPYQLVDRTDGKPGRQTLFSAYEDHQLKLTGPTSPTGPSAGSAGGPKGRTR